jgi:hypothetical protein
MVSGWKSLQPERTIRPFSERRLSMVFGMSLQTYTLIHVLISFAGISSGFVVMFGLLTGKRLDRWTATFLATTAATSITGYGFPVTGLLPSHIIGAISLVVLAIATVARSPRHLAGGGAGPT